MTQFIDLQEDPSNFVTPVLMDPEPSQAHMLSSELLADASKKPKKNAKGREKGKQTAGTEEDPAVPVLGVPTRKSTHRNKDL